MSLLKTNSRPWVSLLMLFGFMGIVATGVLSYVIRYNSVLSAVHTVFGLVFVLYGTMHLLNNIKPLLSYIKRRHLRKVIWANVIFVPFAIVSLAAGLPPLQWVIDAGYALKELKPIDRQSTTILHTRIGQTGRELSVDVKAGEYYSGPGATVLGVTITGVPQMAIWLERANGDYLETLYVTKKASNGSYIQSLFGGETAIRPEALPHWSHARGVRTGDGSLMPNASKPVVDALTGATPTNSFDLRTVAEAHDMAVVIKLEINRSFDYNETYHPDAFPDDLVYSGSGNSAQPSLIYASQVDFDNPDQYYFMRLIGHGHHSGKDGNIYQDLSGVTTAKKMVDRAIVEVL